MKPKLYFFGADCRLSFLVLKQLCERRLGMIRAVYSPAPAKDDGLRNLPVTTRGSETELARLGLEYDIPCLTRQPPACPGSPAQAHESLLLSVCYPRRLPTRLLSQFSLAVNLHPSMLPAYRGPAPLFWQLRDDRRQIGVTLHHLDSDLDTGPVCLQQPLDLADDDTLETIEHKITSLGVQLIGQLITLYTNDRPIPSTAQSTLGSASYQGFPQAQDYIIPCNWTATHAYRFTRGATAFTRQLPFQLQCDKTRFHLGAASALAPRLAGTGSTSYVIDSEKNLRIQFADASVVFDSSNYRFGARDTPFGA